MAAVFTALGLVLVIEGLALVLAPSRIVEVLALLVSLGPVGRRRIGLAAVAAGVGVVALVRALT
ncbi:DUF2065 family protein [Rhodobacter capsulatus]|uniref:DUF2065 family protein n=1 Tax=Rhodobacter capsulatus TaxID=1061 RepID=UPI0003D32C05|nr:DUF2065 family protein [Rhodobacter capsulatus]ETD84103.1 hypothetical protein U703_06485 [Rhodobacter capsulatus YW1]